MPVADASQSLKSDKLAWLYLLGWKEWEGIGLIIQSTVFYILRLARSQHLKVFPRQGA